MSYSSRMPSIFDSAAFNQNLFFPRSDEAPTPSGTEEFFVEVGDSVRVHVRRHLAETARFSLLFFHGNGEIVSDYDGLRDVFAQLGAELTVCDYRGYGKSEGAPSLRTSLEDAHAIYRYLQENGKLKDPVCVMGRSLGSAPAIELCSGHPEIAACVIESGYADPIPLVERRGLKIDATTPEEDRLFNNSRKITQLSCPLLILHGEEDCLIGPQEAQLNHQQAGSKAKHLEILAGVGHNDMMMAQDNGYFVALKRFFDAHLPGGG